jgi:hypothetical protein
MKKLALAAVLAVSAPALAQQVAQQLTCQSLLDGGTFEVCGNFTTNYQPVAGTCLVSVPGGSSAATTINVLGSPDGIHFGAIADAGLSITTVVNGDGGPVSVASTFAISPFDPYQSIQITGSATAIDGGAGGPGALNCYVGVVQTQTLHGRLGVTRPKDVSSVK